MTKVSTDNLVITMMFWSLLMLNMIDAGTTTYLISVGGIDVEVNPFMKWIIIHYGYVGMVSTKIGFIGMLFLVYLTHPNYPPRPFYIGLILSNTVYLVLCVHNIILVGFVARMLGQG